MSEIEVVTKILKALLGSENIDDTITMPASADPANDVSIYGALRKVFDENTTLHNDLINDGRLDLIFDHISLQGEFTNVVAVTADFTSATWNTQATHELFTVTGAVRLRVLPICTGNVTESAAGAPTICLGVEGDTDLLVPDTDVTAIDLDMLWLTATPADFYLDTDLKVMVTNDNDIGYEIKVDGPLDGGSIVFLCAWTPIESGATVVAGAGGVL